MSDPQRILVVQPTWVGDAVMATPTLRALRQLYPNAHITYLLKRYVKPIYNGMPWADRLMTYRTGKTDKKAGRQQFLGLIARLRKGRFDTAVLLPGSFKSALIVKMAGIPRRVGYDRDGRGFLLTDKLLPPRAAGQYIPTPIIKYYLGIAQYLGSTERDLTMQLFVTPSEERQAKKVLDTCGFRPDQRPVILLNPGAQYGSSKCWPPEYFAELADMLVQNHNAQILISSAPRERDIVDEILRRMNHPALDLARAGLTLGALKSITRRCDLLITNDTGPRHIAAAMGIPLIALFGPTHPEWTDIDYPKERILSVPVHCGPCQLKICPLDHRCMTRLIPQMVYDAAIPFLSPSLVDRP